MDTAKLGKWLMIGGAVAAGAGAAAWLFARSAGLGRAVEVKRQGGMTLKHHRSAHMPTKKRVALLQDLVWDSVRNPQMRHLALAITGKGKRRVKVQSREFDVVGANCPSRDGLCEAKAIDRWLRENVRYTGDVAPVKQGSNGPVEAIDYFASADRVAEFGGEDCDGHSLLAATLLALNGITPRFRVTAPTRFAADGHIYTVAGLPKTNPTKFVAVDSTLPNGTLGTEAAYGRKSDYAPVKPERAEQMKREILKTKYKELPA